MTDILLFGKTAQRYVVKPEITISPVSVRFIGIQTLFPDEAKHYQLDMLSLQ
jgi:hypothetical protein